MADIKATNNFVFVLRAEADSETSGYIIPGIGQEKPSRGKIMTIGDLVGDKLIKGSKNKTCLFFKGAGFPVEHEGVEYLVLTSDQIIGIV